MNIAAKCHSQIHMCEDVPRSIENAEEATVFYYEPAI